MNSSPGAGAEVAAVAEIDGVLEVAPVAHADRRGTLVETYRREWLGPAAAMVQANRCDRLAGSVVAFHYHLVQADYWYVVAGHAHVVLHDLRAGSPTAGATLSRDLGEVDGGPNNHRGLYIPPGVAHGYAARSHLIMTYLVTRPYDPADELGLAWDDPAVGAAWGEAEPLLSERDRANPRLDQISSSRRPTWTG